MASTCASSAHTAWVNKLTQAVWAEDAVTGPTDIGYLGKYWITGKKGINRQ